MNNGAHEGVGGVDGGDGAAAAVPQFRQGGSRRTSPIVPARLLGGEERVHGEGHQGGLELHPDGTHGR